MRIRSLLTCALLFTSGVMAQNAAPPVATPAPGQILISGTVPDEATKAAILTKVRDLYGADKVVDQIAIGSVVLPANWSGYVQKLINPNLKLITKGQLKVDGNTVSVKGEVGNEAQRQAIASDFATSLNPTYTVNNGLRVASSEQAVLDTTLGNRIVEFDIGQASITPTGTRILDEMAATLKKLKFNKVEVIGHTDNQGLRAANLSLSQARADAVKGYLTSRGITPEAIVTSGQGPDRPVASNGTVDGRARNRRIEFRIAQ